MEFLQPYSSPSLSREAVLSALGQTQNNSSSGENLASAKPAPATPVPDEKGVYQVSGAVSAPKLIHYVDAKYSKEAKRAKLTGSCVVSLIVDREGKPQNVHIVQPLGQGLDENAVKAIQKYRFEPAMYQGKPVPVEIKIEARFGDGS